MARHETFLFCSYSFGFQPNTTFFKATYAKLSQRDVLLGENQLHKILILLKCNLTVINQFCFANLIYLIYDQKYRLTYVHAEVKHLSSDIHILVDA